MKVTTWGEPMVTMVGYEIYVSIMESLEIMSDPDLMALLRRSLDEARAGRPPPQKATEYNFARDMLIRIATRSSRSS